jgi:transposase
MKSPKRKRYPSDLTDAQWSRFEDLLPTAPSPVGRPRRIRLRDVVNAINYRWETGCVWRMLPHDFPAWATVYSYFRLWQKLGLIRRLREILLERKPKVVRGRRPAQFAAAARTAPSAPADRHETPSDTGFSAPHGRGEEHVGLTPRRSPGG